MSCAAFFFVILRLVFHPFEFFVHREIHKWTKRMPVSDPVEKRLVRLYG